MIHRAYTGSFISYYAKSENEWRDRIEFLADRGFDVKWPGLTAYYSKERVITISLNSKEIHWNTKGDWPETETWDEVLQDLGWKNVCIKTKCTCDKLAMFYGGCKCGAFQEELKNENW